MEEVERSDSGCILKVELTGIKENSKSFGLSSWRDGAIYWDGEVCGRIPESLVSDMRNFFFFFLKIFFI